MSVVYIAANTAEVIAFEATDSTGAAVTGATTLRVSIRRVSDGFFYDFNDSTFKTAASVTTIGGTLSEVSSTNFPGLYTLSWAGAAAGIYQVRFYLSSGTAVANVPAWGEIRVAQLAAPGDAMDLVTDAVDAAALATSAVTELQSGLATSTALAAVQTDVDDIQARLPASLVGGRIDASVGAMAADTLTALALASDAVAEIQSGLATSSALSTAQADLDDIQTRLPAALIGGRIDATVGAMQADVLTSSALATSAVTEIQSGLATSSAVAALPSASSNAAALLDASLSGHSTAGTAGEALGRIDATVSSRSSHSAADVWAVGTRSLTGIGSSGIASQTSVDALPTAAQNADAVWDEPLSGHTTAGSAGTALSATAAASPPSAAAIADAVWDEALSGHIGAGSAGAALALVDVEVSSRATAAGVWATAEGSPSSGTYGWAVQLLRQLGTNRLEVDTTSSGRQRLFADDGTTVRLTWTLRDGASGAITTPTGSPALRGAAT